MNDKISEAELPAFDHAKGIVVVMLGKNALAGQGAGLNAVHAGAFVMDSQGKAVAGDKMLDGGMEAVVFVNVTPGATQVTFTPAEKCTLADSIGPVAEHLVSAKTVTSIPADCTQ